MFVSNQGEQLSRFRIAVERSDPEAAIEAMRRMDVVAPGDALELCRLLARAGDPRFDRAARRWLSQFADSASLGDLQVAAAAIGALRAEPDSERAWDALVGLIRARN
jgi:hypothetical protein